MKRTTASIISSLLILFITETTAFGQIIDEYQLGDVDMSGDITASDALEVLRASIYLTNLTNEQMILADIDKNDSINATDALYILRKSIYLNEETRKSKPEEKKETSVPRNDTFAPDTSTDTNTDTPTELIKLSSPVYGIDVSHWQGYIDWNEVKASGIDFAIIRAGGGIRKGYRYDIAESGQGVDAYFEENYNGAKAAGIDVGIYWFSYADAPWEAEWEAESCLEAIKDKQLEYPVFFDLEMEYQFNYGPDRISNMTKAFCDKIESAGYESGFYMSSYFAKNYLSDDIRKNTDCWVAQWGSDPTYSDPYTMWQYGTRSVNGITGPADADICYYDYPTYIKSNHKNGW